MMEKISVGIAALIVQVAYGVAPDAINIGGNGTGRGKAQAYMLAGS